MIASVSIVPLGVGEELKEFVAALVPIIEGSGLPYTMGAMTTTIEGDQDRVMALIMQCHNHMISKAGRVLTHITIDDRRGGVNRLTGKVKDVEKVLGRKISHEQ